MSHRLIMDGRPSDNMGLDRLDVQAYLLTVAIRATVVLATLPIHIS